MNFAAVGGGISVSVNRGYGRGLSVGYSSYRPVYRQTYRTHQPAWHNTSHYDYHRGGVVRHGNHFDYRPGHYDYHRSGHWHH